MHAVHRTVSDDAQAQETELLPDELEITESVCVIRLTGADGEERAFTLRPGDSVGAILLRNDLHRDAARIAAVVRAD